MQHQAALTVLSLVCAYLTACCEARHAQTHEHGHVKRKVMPKAHVYHKDTRRNTPMLSLKTGGCSVCCSACCPWPFQPHGPGEQGSGGPLESAGEYTPALRQRAGTATQALLKCWCVHTCIGSAYSSVAMAKTDIKLYIVNRKGKVRGYRL